MEQGMEREKPAFAMLGEAPLLCSASKQMFILPRIEWCKK
jgi:hypothetical protein